MTISEQVEKDYLAAYKAKETTKLNTLRILKTAAKNRQVELMQSLQALADDEYLNIILRQAKQRQESIDLYVTASRHDLAEIEKAELEILREYLPKQLSESEITAIIEKACAPHLTDGMKAMGKVIQGIMNDYKGQVDGKAVSEAVKARLQNS